MPDAPFALMVAGPNGSGKTTLTNQLRQSGIDFGEYINADEIAKSLVGTYDMRVRRAQQIADEKREACIREGKSFSFETVMSHPSKVDVLRRSKDAGFRVAVYFVATESPELNVRRVAQRVALGGHDVPADRIRARYARTLELLPEALRHADDAVLFDNTVGQNPGDPAILRPFCRRVGLKLTLAPPLPTWALESLREWLPPTSP